MYLAGETVAPGRSGTSWTLTPPELSAAPFAIVLDAAHEEITGDSGPGLRPSRG